MAIQGRKDYLILQMVDGTMTFTVDNGRGPIMAIFKPEDEFKFCDGNWHEIHGNYILDIFLEIFDHKPRQEVVKDTFVLFRQFTFLTYFDCV